MATYRCEIDIVQRSKGQSVVASAAYASRSKIKDERTGKVYDYSKRSDKVYDEIILPDNAPAIYKNRAKLWNTVEQFEKNKDAQVGRSIGLDLPIELNREQQIALVREYVQTNFVERGMIADVAIHDNEGKEPRNPHAHIILTMREIDESGSFKNKAKKIYMLDNKGERIRLKNGRFKSRKENINDWDKKETLLQWRENWANTQNKYLEQYGHKERVSHLSYEERGIDRIPMRKMGPNATAMERRYQSAGLGERPNIAIENDMIRDINREKEELVKEKNNFSRQISILELCHKNKLEELHAQIILAEEKERFKVAYSDDFCDYARVYISERKINDRKTLERRERLLDNNVPNNAIEERQKIQKEKVHLDSLDYSLNLFKAAKYKYDKKVENLKCDVKPTMLNVKAQKTAEETIWDISRDLMESLKNKEYNIGVYNKSMARVYGIERSAKDSYEAIKNAIMDNAERYFIKCQKMEGKDSTRVSWQTLNSEERRMWQKRYLEIVPVVENELELRRETMKKVNKAIIDSRIKILMEKYNVRAKGKQHDREKNDRYIGFRIRQNEPEMGQGMRHLIDLSDEDEKTKNSWRSRTTYRDNDFER